MNSESNQIENDFNGALSKYKTGVDLNEVAFDFQRIINQIPNHFAAWTCLAWLNLLMRKNDEALKFARQAVKLNGQDPQARMNLVLALLATNNKGVREHIEIIKRMKIIMPELNEELNESIEDGFARYPDWPELNKVKTWLD